MGRERWEGKDGKDKIGGGDGKGKMGRRRWEGRDWRGRWEGEDGRGEMGGGKWEGEAVKRKLGKGS